MIAKALFFLLLGLSVYFVLRGLRRREGVFEFPVLFAGAFAASMVPELVNHVFYPGRLPAQVYRDHGVEYGILMCILCLVCGIAGYARRPKDPALLRRWIPNVEPERLFWAGVVLCLIGLFGAAKLAALAGGWEAQFTEGGHYALHWQGAPVKWTYVAKLLPLGLILCLNSALIRGSLGKWSFTILAMLYPLGICIFMGRRSMIFGLLATIAVSLWFQKRWAPPRWLSMAGLVTGGLLIILVPHYRSYANQTGDVKAAIERVDTTQAIEEYAQGEHLLGVDNLIIGIPALLKYPAYGFGTGFWNGAVAYFVPGQLVGYELKNSLMFDLGGGSAFFRYAGMVVTGGAFATGPYSVFREFSFFGCLVYYFLGLFYRRLWLVANERRHLGAHIIYVSIAVVVPFAVVESLPMAICKFILAVGVLETTLWLVGSRRELVVREDPVRSRTKARPKRGRIGQGAAEIGKRGPVAATSCQLGKAEGL